MKHCLVFNSSVTAGWGVGCYEVIPLRVRQKKTHIHCQAVLLEGKTWSCDTRVLDSVTLLWPLIHCWPRFSSLLYFLFTLSHQLRSYNLTDCHLPVFFFFFWGYDGIMTFKTAYLILERLSRWFKACLVGSTHLLFCTTTGLFYICVWDTLKQVWLRVHIHCWAVQVCFVDVFERWMLILSSSAYHRVKVTLVFIRVDAK